MGIVPASKGWVAGQIRFKFIKSEADDNEYNGTRQRESDWYNCLGTTLEGGIAISGAWTSQDIQVEVNVLIMIRFESYSFLR